MARKNNISQFNKKPVVILPHYALAFFVFMALFQATDFYFYKFESVEINQRIIFGLWGNNAVAVLFAIAGLMVLYFLFWFSDRLDKLFLLLFCAVLSNCLDRLFYGGVVDYFKIFSWPSFNIADIVIILVIIIRLIMLLKKQK